MKETVIHALLLTVLFTSTTKANHTNKENSTLKQGIIGAAAGCTEVGINHPLVYIKNMLQQGKPISKNPRLWYRGFGINLGSMVPVTAVQVAAQTALAKKLYQNKELTDAEKLATSVGAGVISSPLSSLSELFILNKQNAAKTTPELAREFYKARGVRGFTRGLLPTAAREAGFATGYLTLAPWLKQQITKNTPITNNEAAIAASGAPAGIICATVTHPFDMIKTMLQ